MKEWRVLKEEAGMTVMEFLHHRVPAAPQGYLRQLLRGGKVRQAGQPLAAENRLREGDRLSVPDSRRLAELEGGSSAAVEILCETDSLLVAFKPAGLAVHRGVGHEDDDLTRRVHDLMRLRKAPFRIAPVHRLDIETSGPVVFGKGARAIAALGRQFMNRQVEKVYLALVAGSMADCGQLTSPVPAKGKLKESATAFRTLLTAGGHSLLELRLETGRSHQIRRQLADAGHPLAGDRRYGGPFPAGLDRLFLHCTRLVLTDPFEGTPLLIECGPPAELVAALSRLGIEIPGAGPIERPETSSHPSYR